MSPTTCLHYLPLWPLPQAVLGLFTGRDVSNHLGRMSSARRDPRVVAVAGGPTGGAAPGTPSAGVAGAAVLPTSSSFGALRAVGITTSPAVNAAGVVTGGATSSAAAAAGVAGAGAAAGPGAQGFAPAPPGPAPFLRPAFLQAILGSSNIPAAAAGFTPVASAGGGVGAGSGAAAGGTAATAAAVSAEARSRHSRSRSSTQLALLGNAAAAAGASSSSAAVGSTAAGGAAAGNTWLGQWLFGGTGPGAPAGAAGESANMSRLGYSSLLQQSGAGGSGGQQQHLPGLARTSAPRAGGLLAPGGGSGTAAGGGGHGASRHLVTGHLVGHTSQLGAIAASLPRRGKGRRSHLHGESRSSNPGMVALDVLDGDGETHKTEHGSGARQPYDLARTSSM